jgi:bifunctional DNA-binding transcriptional regulator/antitoxin component of YhaV-PrlF toxin-antitoxin module
VVDGHGPVPIQRKISPKSQVVIPSEILDALRLSIGDDIWWVINPDLPGTAVLMPRRLMEEVFGRGWRDVDRTGDE